MTGRERDFSPILYTHEARLEESILLPVRLASPLLSTCGLYQTTTCSDTRSLRHFFLQTWFHEVMTCFCDLSVQRKIIYSLAATVCLLLHEWGSCQSKQFAIKSNVSPVRVDWNYEQTDQRLSAGGLFMSNI